MLRSIMRYNIHLLSVLVGDCSSWSKWSEALSRNGHTNNFIDFPIYASLVIVLASFSCLLTLQTRIPMILTDILVADAQYQHFSPKTASTKTYYTAAGSGVAEVKLIISGFWLRGYLSAKTLLIKTFALILSAASGMSLGKEGPYIHLATCISEIVPRIFCSHQHQKENETLRAGAASGLAVAFGAPVSGVVFALEDFGFVTVFSLSPCT